MRLLNFISERIDALERIRKGNQRYQTYRYGGMFFTVPIIFTIGFIVARRWPNALDQVGAWELWVGFVSCATVLTFATGAWQRYVPTRIHIFASVAAWATLIWTIVYLRMWDM